MLLRIFRQYISWHYEINASRCNNDISNMNHIYVTFEQHCYLFAGKKIHSDYQTALKDTLATVDLHCNRWFL